MLDNKEMIERLNKFIVVMQHWINDGEGRITSDNYTVAVNLEHLKLVKKMLKVVVLELSESKPNKSDDLETRVEALEDLMVIQIAKLAAATELLNI